LRAGCSFDAGVHRLLCPLAVVLVLPASASGACRHRGERVVARSPAAIVTTTSHRGVDITTSVVRACLLATRRSRVLGHDEVTESESSSTYGFALAGRYVAYVSAFGSKYMDGLSRVVVLDLRTGRRRSALATPPDGDLNAARLSDVRVDARGRAAYVVDDGVGAAVAIVEGARGRTLDVGRIAALGGLAIDGEEVTWRHGDETRRAPLSPADRCRASQAEQATTEAVVAGGRACLRAEGDWLEPGGRPWALVGPLLAVRRHDTTYRVLDLRTDAWLGPPTPAAPRSQALLAPSGALVILDETRDADVLYAQAPDGTRTELDRGQIGNLRLLDGEATWSSRDAVHKAPVA
jgi:hypothetical protein